VARSKTGTHPQGSPERLTPGWQRLWEDRTRGVLFQKGRKMEFALLAASILAVLGWFTAGWMGLDSWCWREHAKRVEAELERVRAALGDCRGQLDRCEQRCERLHSERAS